MAIDCSDVPSNVTYSCANPWGAKCTSKDGFQFTSLWNYTKSIQAACPSDDRLFLGHEKFASSQNASLTQAACAAIAGSDWKSYPTPDIWNRLTTWRMDHDEDHEQDLEDRDWKALTIVTDAYGEWSEDTSAQHILHTALMGFFQASSELKDNFMTAVRQTARALAADRSTKLLPIAVAQFFFIGAVGIAIFRTTAAASNSTTSDTVFINVEAHSIAFSALYFWIIPAVFLSSIIGVSQTEAAIPRILRRFQVDLARMALPENLTVPEDCVDDDGLVLPKRIKLLNECLKDDQKRVYHGGVYSWQPSNVKASRAGSLWGIRGLLPYSIVILGTMAGTLVSSLVPPVGFDCRNATEILLCIIWILSAQADRLLIGLWSQNSNRRKTLFWVTTIKDFLAMTATMGGIVVTQIGIFNRCDCYTNWGKTGLALPQMPDVASVLIRRLNMGYPLITFLCIGIEIIVVPLLISFQFRHAFRVFVQRDDRQSNAPWLWKAYRIIRACKETLSHALSLRPFKRSRFDRGVTSSGESGNRDESIEMPILEMTEEPEGVQEEADVVNGPPNPTANIQLGSFQSRTSSRESTLQSGSDALSQSDTRRRNTEPHRAEDDEASGMRRPRDEKLAHRKPLPGNSPLQEFQSRP